MPSHPLPVLGGVFYARVNAIANLKPVSNILVFKKDGISVGDANDAVNSSHVATAIGTWWPFLAASLLHQSYVGVNVQCYPLGSPALPPFVSAMTAAGGSTTTSSFLQVAGVVKHNIYRRGRGSQGRTFLSPVGTDQVGTDGITMTSTWVTNATSHWSSLITNVLVDLGIASSGTWSYVQLSRLGTGATYPVVNSIGEANVGSQDRRLGR